MDASVLIAYLDAEDAHHDRAETLLAREIDDDFAVNSLTLAEVLVAPARDRRIDEATETLDALGVRERDFPRGTGAKLARIRADTTLKMPGCCVLLAAEDAEARLASFDDGLNQAARARNIVVLDG